MVEQDAGYYAAWCLNEKFAPIMITNLNYMLSGIVSGLVKNDVKANYLETKKIVEEQCGLVNSLKKANYHMKSLFSKDLLSGKRRGTMRIYYDVGNGFSEKNSVCSKVNNGGKFNIILKIPQNTKPIKKLRFDPEENGNIVLKDPKITVEYKNGHKSNVNILRCLNNGVYFKRKILFLNEDPQIVWKEHNKEIEKIHISSEIFRNVKVNVILKLIIKTLVGFKKCLKKLLSKG